MSQLREMQDLVQQPFGRRELTHHAWVQIGRRQKLPCTIRSFTPKGALLEFDCLPPPSNQFRLIVDHKAVDVECNVRHRQAKALGVNFEGFERPIAGQEAKSGQDLAQKMRYQLCGQA